jgi:sec-independent protein translocase protein TatB
VFNLGMGEITVILLLALIFLGPGKLPDLAAGLGKIIKEIRKATSDVKNEIALDDSFRKPFEELRDAVTLHPDELKRRDEVRKYHEDAARRAAEEAAQAAQIEAAQAAEATNMPPDGLGSPVQTLGVTQPSEAVLNGLPKPGVPGMTPPAPNDTIVMPTPPKGATLDDIPTPPPATVAEGTPKVAPVTPGTPPVGTVSRDTLRGVKPAAPPAPPAPPVVADASNTTQILKEEDLLPAVSTGRPPPPPHLPGLRPAGAPRPGGPPILPPNPLDKKKT